MSELKPCPFCGSTVLRGPISQEYIGDTYAPAWWIECMECPCVMAVDGETEDGVVNAWNRRKEEI